MRPVMPGKSCGPNIPTRRFSWNESAIPPRSRHFAYGASDQHAAYPAEGLVRPDDLAATLFYLLGIDPHTEVRGQGGRPVTISGGQPVMGVVA